MAKAPRPETLVETQRRQEACQRWLDDQRVPHPDGGVGFLPFDRLLADRAFAAGWRAKKLDR